MSVSTKQANEVHFDKIAKSLSHQASRSAQELAKRSARAVLKSYTFNEDSTEVMDFACGHGLLSQQLSPYCKSVVGVDISQAMVDLYNESARNQGLSGDELRAVCFDVLDNKFSSDCLNGQKFDVVVCASAYHHFDSIDDMTIALSSYLKPGGVLIVVDLIQPEDSKDLNELFPDHGEGIVAHRGGFKEDTIVQAFRNAALEDIQFGAAVNVKKKGRNLQLFLAKGSRGLHLEASHC